MKILIVLLIWAGCLLPYLASTRQQLLPVQVPKAVAWAGFCILQLLAVFGFSYFYDAIAASLIVLMFVMCMWVGLTIVAAHLSRRLVLVCTIAIVFFSLITLTGVGHVA